MKRTLNSISLASAIVWAAVLLGVALLVPEEFARLLPIVGGGAVAHVVILGGAAKRAGREG